MTDIGLDLLRQQTLDFIALDPTPVVLKTTGVSRAPGGGYVKTNDVDRPEQTFKIIAQAANDGEVVANDGVDIQYDLILLGAHDCAFEIGDYWTHNGVKYVIRGILPTGSYQRKAAVKAYGAEPIGG